MKTIIFAIILSLLPIESLAACDPDSDIKQNQDGSYTYTRSCHLDAGKAFKKVSLLDEKVSLLETKIDLKDSQLFKQEQRAEMWMETANKINDKLIGYEKAKDNDKILNFGLGMLFTFASVWAAGQISK